jgi:hypothetical protein
MRTVGGRTLVGFLMLAGACGSHRGALPGDANDAATTGLGGASGDAGRADGTPAPVDSATPATDSGGMADATGPIVDATCVTTHTGARLPVDVLLIFDRSGSMVEDPSTGQNCLPQATCPSKWNQATAAIEQAVMNTESTVRWGLTMFPSPILGNTTCNVAAGAQVPIAPMNAMAITTALLATAPSGSTPTTAALTLAGDYLNTLTTPNQRFMVLVTDGLPTCAAGNANAADDANAIMAVATQASRGFGTFVVGIATAQDALADATLSAMSTAGMHPRPGTPNYYVTNNTAELVTALDSIASQVDSCTFSLDAVPPAPDNVTVTGDGNIIPLSASNGWLYQPGMRAITLSGDYCQRVMTGALRNVVAIFGC